MCTFLSQAVWEFSIKNQNYAVERSLKQANKFDVMVSVVDSYQKRLLFKYNKKNQTNVEIIKKKKHFDLPHCLHLLEITQSCV